MSDRWRRLTVVIAGIVLVFGAAFGVAFAVGGGDEPAPSPVTVTEGFDGRVVETQPTTTSVALPPLRSASTIPDLVQPPAPQPGSNPTPGPVVQPTPTPTPTPSPPTVVTVIEAG